MRNGKFLQLVRLAYWMGPDIRSGVPTYTSRIVLGTVVGSMTASAQECTINGAVTAIDFALRAAIGRMKYEVPEIQLWPYQIDLTNRRERMSSPVVAQARIKLDGWKATRRVRHADGVTAAAFLLFDAYDHLLFVRWQERLAAAQTTPEEVLRTMREECGAAVECPVRSVARS